MRLSYPGSQRSIHILQCRVNSPVRFLYGDVRSCFPQYPAQLIFVFIKVLMKATTKQIWPIPFAETGHKVLCLTPNCIALSSKCNKKALRLLLVWRLATCVLRFVLHTYCASSQDVTYFSGLFSDPRRSRPVCSYAQQIWSGGLFYFDYLSVITQKAAVFCRHKSKANSLQAWTVPEGSRRLRISRQSAHENCKVIIPTYRPLPPGNSWYSFLLEAESTPGP